MIVEQAKPQRAWMRGILEAEGCLFVCEHYDPEPGTFDFAIMKIGTGLYKIVPVIRLCLGNTVQACIGYQPMSSASIALESTRLDEPTAPKSQ